MPYDWTIDERYGGTFTSSSPGSRDAPSYTNNTYVISVGYSNRAFGLLSDAYYTADIDTYSLGILDTGSYRVNVDSVDWDYLQYSYSSVSKFEVLDSFGWVVDTVYGSYTDIDFTVTTDATYYVKITGPSYGEAQYSVSYEKTAELQVFPNPADNEIFIKFESLYRINIIQLLIFE